MDGPGPAAIVVGVDESRSSLRAAAYAAGLARRQHARLVVVYARAHPGGLLSTVDPGGVGVVATLEAHDRVEADLRAAIGEAGAGLTVELVVRTGDPYGVLAEVAHEYRAGAVVVGRPERLAHRLAGSVARRLVRCGRWPVTIVP